MPLLNLLKQGPQHPYLLDHDQEIGFDHFRQKVAGIYTWLLKQPVGRYAIWVQDPVLLGAGLFALWQHGSSALLLPSGQEQILEQGLAVSVGLFSDEPQQNTGKPFLNLNQLQAAEEPVWKHLDPEQDAVTLFTSGSTGKPKEIQKKLKHLNEEIKVLEAQFGHKMKQKLVTSSVYGFHLYGLLFRLLWPLATQRLFSRQTIFMPEDLERNLERYPKQCFISGPAVLSRFCDYAWHKKQRANLLVFSSGGELTQEVSSRWANIFGYHPIGILGSTETGGVAQKSFQQERPLWQVFDSVKIGQNSKGQLVVDSPFFTTSDNSPFIMGDQIEVVSPTEFHLLGRIDRIIKIEEKRLNLVEMEQHLTRHNEVIQAVLLESKRVWPNRKRQSIIAVVQLKKPVDQMTSGQKSKITKKMKEHLKAWYPAVVLPRYWRFVKEIPPGPAGKPDFEMLYRIIL